MEKKNAFGRPLGAYKGVIAYSNRKTKGCSPQKNYVDELFTGLQYECVEYARRWLITVKRLSFKMIHFASSIWDLESLESIHTKQPIKLTRVPNGSDAPPQVDSLLIYKKAFRTPWGHVAVIAEVDIQNNFIRVAEQNEGDAIWQGEYAREIPLEIKDGKYWIRDKYKLYGWMVYESIQIQ